MNSIYNITLDQETAHFVLTFSDGDSSGGDVIGKYCDTIYPEVIYSTENGMYIEFQSDSFSTYKGFEITVSAVKAGTHKSN